MQGELLLLDDVLLLLNSHLKQVILTGELLHYSVQVYDLVNSHLID